MIDCIEWAGQIQPNGYGRRYIRGQRRHEMAHRWVWALSRGPIPKGLHVLHSCDNPPCVNLDHLSLGTPLENMADMKSKGRSHSRLAAITHCKNGHEFSKENTRWGMRGGYPTRQCRTCQRENQRRYRARKPERKEVTLND